MKINWNYIKGFSLLILVVFLYGFTHVKNNAKKVRDIAVDFEEGNSLFMDYQMVNKLLIQNGKTVKNQVKTVIDLHKLEKSILLHPMVANAAVFLTVDGLLKVKIKQRTPIARIIAGNKSYYVDKQAKAMPLSPNYSARVLLFSGNINEADNEEIHFLATEIMNDEFLKKQIVGAYKTPNNEFILDTRIGNQKINLGKVKNLALKFKNLEAFFSKTMADKTIDNYASINLKYNNQVVCTKK